MVLFWKVNNGKADAMSRAKLGEYHNGGGGDMNMFVITGFNALVWLCLAGIM